MRVNWLAENSRLPCASLPLPCNDASESEEEVRDGEEAMDMRLGVLRNSCANGGVDMKKSRNVSKRCKGVGLKKKKKKKKRIRVLETARKKKSQKRETMAEAGRRKRRRIYITITRERERQKGKV
jgi:hypothetical protein